MTKTKTFEGIPGRGSKVFRQLFGEIEDPRYSIFNAMTNLSAVARTATYFDDVAAQNRKVQSEGGRGFFWDSEELAKQAVNSPGTGIEIVKLDDVIQKLPGGSTLSNPLSGKYTTKEIAEGFVSSSNLQSWMRGEAKGQGPLGATASAAIRYGLLTPKAGAQYAKTILSIGTSTI